MQNLAEALQSEAQNLGLRSEVVDLKNYEPEDSLSEEVHDFGRIYICSINVTVSLHFVVFVVIHHYR